MSWIVRIFKTIGWGWIATAVFCMFAVIWLALFGENGIEDLKASCISGLCAVASAFFGSLFLCLASDLANDQEREHRQAYEHLSQLENRLEKQVSPLLEEDGLDELQRLSEELDLP